MKQKETIFYMQCAKNAGEMSHATRKKVGAVLVNPRTNDIISYSYNGTPTGFDNCCEIENVTKQEVLHAESNCLSKAAKTNKSSDGGYMFVTLSPCYECSKLIIQCGVKRVYYLEKYRNLTGISLLEKANIKVFCLNENCLY